jgi:hypothetical protein
VKSDLRVLALLIALLSLLDSRSPALGSSRRTVDRTPYPNIFTAPDDPPDEV